jgi:hypothetical protein
MESLNSVLLFAILANDMTSQWQQLSFMFYNKPALQGMELLPVFVTAIQARKQNR